MRKIICNYKWIGFICLLFIGHLLSAGLIDLYKKETITLVNANNYGNDTDWESLFYQPAKYITMAADGSIFVSNTKDHNIYKFGAAGQFLKKIGRRGQGPGDLYYPLNLSVLDGKYLVIAEYPGNRQINLFDLQGKYIKKLKTEHYPFLPIALKKSKIAYLHKKTGHGENRSAEIFIKDVKSGEEKLVDTLPVVSKNLIHLGGGRALTFENFIGQVFISRTKNGCLAVGLSNTPDIKIYSIQGRLVNSFRLKIIPEPVTAEYIRKIKIESIKRHQERHKDIAKQLKHTSFERMFGKHLPYYREILVDTEGNFLIFKWPNCIDKCEIFFQVYSPEGEYVCNTKIDYGKYHVDTDVNIGNMVFSNSGIFGLFQLKDSDDIFLRLIKVRIN